MKNYKIYNLAIVLALVLASMFSYGQSNLTLYHMQSLPQSVYSNPANRSDAKLYIGIPALSSLAFNFSSNGIHPKEFNNAFIQDEGKDSFILDVNSLSNIFDKNTFVNVNVSQDWVNFGFKQGKNFFSFNISEKVKTRTEIPGDVFDLVFQGNGGENLGRTFDFNVGLDLIHTREYAVGYQRYLLNDRLNIGARAKYIYGLSRFETERNNASFYTAEEDFAMTISSDLKFNMSSAIFAIDSNRQPNPKHLVYGAKNHGWGLDIGASYDLNDRITLSASIIDMGIVRWNENTISYESEVPGARYNFEGVELKNIFIDSINFEEAIRNLGDTLADIFRLDSHSSSFTTGLMSDFYLGAKFHLTKGNSLGVLLYGSVYNRSFYPAVTLSYNARFKKVLGLSFSYTAMRGNALNLGAGMSLNMKTVQWYIVSDNVLGPLTGQFNTLSFRTGLNLTFGRRSGEENKVFGFKNNNQF